MSKFVTALIAAWSILLLFSDVVYGCGRGSIFIKDNQYHNVLVAISETVPENPALVNRIKEVLTDASAKLYQASNSRAYFGNITILVPKTWLPNPSYELLRNETIDTSDIVIDAPNPSSGSGNRPFVVKTTPCGDFGHYMHLTPEYLLDPMVAAQYGRYDKVLVHEWAHLRYGVYDEYPTESGEHFYAGADGEIEATRCTKILTGSRYNPVTGGSCKVERGLIEPNCRFKDDKVTDFGRYGSLMYRQLDHISVFCDNDPSDPATIHNSRAPNQQNKKCGGRSVWEVMREHQDFYDGTKPINEEVDADSTEPNFKVVRISNKRTVLVMDTSGSMAGDNIMKQNQACFNFITVVMSDGEQLGLVHFAGSATRLADMTEVDGASRAELITKLPSEARGGTSIGAGIVEGLKVLTAGGGMEGGTMIIISDGEENQDPKIVDVLHKVVEAGVVVHTIAFTDEADSRMDSLAAVTGGLSFLYTNADTSNALNDAFVTIGELNQNPLTMSYVIKSEARSLSGTYNGVVTVDRMLNHDTLFLFDYSLADGVSVNLTSPLGDQYTEDSGCTKDTTYRVIRCQFTGEAQVGEWRYDVTSTTPQRVAVSVKSRAGAGQTPLVTQTYWGSRAVDLSGTQPQRLYASVSRGYEAVINAAVEAEIETPGGDIERLSLSDNGAGADIAPDDGVYSAYFLAYNGDGRYNVKVAVNGTPSTVVRPQQIVGASTVADGRRLKRDVADEKIGPFQRQASGGSFETSNFTVTASGKRYPPGTILDLRIAAVNTTGRQVSLEWTAQGAQLDVGQASQHEIRHSLNYSFANYYRVTQQDVVFGGNLTQPKPAGSVEGFTILLPPGGEVTYYLAVFSRDLAGRDAASDVSNIVSASMRPVPQDGVDLTIVLIVVFSLMGLLFIGIVVIYITSAMKRRKSVRNATLPSAKDTALPDIPRQQGHEQRVHYNVAAGNQRNAGQVNIAFDDK